MTFDTDTIAIMIIVSWLREIITLKRSVKAHYYKRWVKNWNTKMTLVKLVESWRMWEVNLVVTVTQ